MGSDTDIAVEDQFDRLSKHVRITCVVASGNVRGRDLRQHVRVHRSVPETLAHVTVAVDLHRDRHVYFSATNSWWTQRRPPPEPSAVSTTETHGKSTAISPRM